MTFLPEGVQPGTAALLIAAAYVTAAITAAFGIGGGVALIALMLNVLPPAVVLPVHGVAQLGSNTGRAWALREHVRWSLVKPFTVGSILGILVASQLFVALPAPALELALALFILWSLWWPRRESRMVPDRAFYPVGFVSSFFTMFVGATGPLIAAFMSAQHLGRRRLVATHATCATIQQGLKVIAFVGLGFAFGEWLPLLAAMVSIGYLGTLSGTRLLAAFSERTFALVFRWTLTLLALRLVWSAATGLAADGS